MQASVLILTFNEENNLPECLGALRAFDDVVVLDSGSTDQTVEVARAYGARLITRQFDNFAHQRNYGLEHGDFRHEWVLHLDADEIVTPEFVAALEQLDPSDQVSAYHVPSKTMFLGKWLRHAGMWPSYQVRLGRLNELRFVQVGHGQREDLPPERLSVFPEAYLHYAFSNGLTAWLSKHAQYASDEVDALVLTAEHEVSARPHGDGVTARRRKIKAAVNRLPLTLRPFLKFFYVYLFRCGFLDGRPGFVYAFMLATYEAMIAAIGSARLGRYDTRGRSAPKNQEGIPMTTRSAKGSKP